MALDLGNTRTKAGIFVKGQLMQTFTSETRHLEASVESWLSTFPDDTSWTFAWISVAQEPPIPRWEIWQARKLRPQWIPIGKDTPLPIRHAYETPETLGTDRIVGVIGALKIAGKGPLLVIDAGTAITYDLMDDQQVYLGGAISPGMDMRFKALHQFTARLPLVDPGTAPVAPLGKSTRQCIATGVVYGIVGEMEKFIDTYREAFGQDLQVFLTGGNLSHFENRLKNINFADPNLTLSGIQHIISTVS